MEETISTPAENVETQTPLEPATDTQPEETQTPENAEQEPEKNTKETAENVEGEETPKEPVIDWEKRAKDNQAEFTRVSQELAELKKQVAAQKPQLVQEGKINPEFEQQYKFDVDNREFLAFDNLARQLEPETRAVVENLLNEARALYNPKNNRAYESKMAQIKDYFRSDIVEQIALEKQNLIGQMKGEFDKALFADRRERAVKVSQAIDEVPELRELVYQDSENYSPEVVGIVKDIFDYTGGIDIESTQKAISKIKELGVKEYLAKQKAEQVKTQAKVPSGQNVQQVSTEIPTAQELRADASLYAKAVKKYGMDKVDEVIMKG